MPKIAVVGSRSFDAYVYFCEKLEYLIQNIEGEIEFCSGGAAGCDSLIRRYASENNYKITEFLPDYKAFPPKVAPIKRNQQIVDKSDYLIAITTGSLGTASTINFAKKQNKIVKIITVGN